MSALLDLARPLRNLLYITQGLGPEQVFLANGNSCGQFAYNALVVRAYDNLKTSIYYPCSISKLLREAINRLWMSSTSYFYSARYRTQVIIKALYMELRSKNSR